MILTEKEAFQIGFFKRAAELGYTPREAVQIHKQAGALDTALTVGLLGLALPTVGGIVTGGLHADMTDVTKEEVERAKQKQRIAALMGETSGIKKRLQQLADRRAAAAGGV